MSYWILWSLYNIGRLDVILRGIILKEYITYIVLEENWFNKIGARKVMKFVTDPKKKVQIVEGEKCVG